MYETTVLITGAGPTGLTLALELARRGISFRLIEAAATPSEGSRGKGIQPRTLEIFDALGVIGPILAAGASIFRLRSRQCLQCSGRLRARRCSRSRWMKHRPIFFL